MRSYWLIYGQVATTLALPLTRDTLDLDVFLDFVSGNIKNSTENKISCFPRVKCIMS